MKYFGYLNFFITIYYCIINIWSSADCTHFSKAKGGLSRDADSRTLSEHLLIIMQEIKRQLLDHVIWDSIIEHVDEYRQMKPNGNISYKAIFKYMDINDLIKK